MFDMNLGRFLRVFRREKRRNVKLNIVYRRPEFPDHVVFAKILRFSISVDADAQKQINLMAKAFRLAHPDFQIESAKGTIEKL